MTTNKRIVTPTKFTTFYQTAIHWLGKIFFVSEDFSFAWRLAAIFSIAIGIALRVWQYASNPSIWVDEAALARNILDRQPWQLLDSLDYGQLAPRGFLIGTKLLAIVFGYSEYTLRLIPFLSGLISLVLFFIVARLSLQPIGAVVAMIMFSMAIPLIFFSSNLKPYSSDVAIALVIFLLTIWLRTHSLGRRSAAAFAIVSLPLLFFSQSAVFPLTVSGIVILIESIIKHQIDQRYRLAIVITWGIAIISAFTYNLWAMTPPDIAYVYRFWLYAFMPSEHIPQWIWTSFQNIFGGTTQSGNFDGALHYPLPIIFVCLAIIGTWVLCIEKPAMAALLAGPLFLVFMASVFRVFPFGTRLSLFLLPALLLILVAGLEKIGRVLIRFRLSSYMPVLLIPFICTSLIQEHFPRRPEHIRPVLQYIQNNWMPGDVLWVYYGAGQAFKYYQHLIPIQGTIYNGECDRAEPRDYLRQLDVVRGQSRVWILFAHGSGRFRFDERKLINNYLNMIGTQLDQFHAPPEDVSPTGAETLLYDLSSTEKLASTSATSFKIDNPFPSALWACYGTMSPLGTSSLVLDALMQTENR